MNDSGDPLSYGDGYSTKRTKTKNPLKRLSSWCNIAFYNCFTKVAKLTPTRVSPELASEHSRPIKNEAKLVIAFFTLLLLLVGGFFAIAIDSAIIGNEWEEGEMCELMDYLTRDATTSDIKMIMTVTTNKTGVIQKEIDRRLPDFIPIDEGDNPFSCRVKINAVNKGPCCHSSFGQHDYNVGDVFPCVFTFTTGYCQDFKNDFADDDFRGLGSNPAQGDDDRVNQMCCEPGGVPFNFGGLAVVFVLCCVIGLGVVWCVLFRLKNGVWNRICPFDHPPPSSHVYDVTVLPVGKRRDPYGLLKVPKIPKLNNEYEIKDGEGEGED